MATLLDDLGLPVLDDAGRPIDDGEVLLSSLPEHGEEILSGALTLNGAPLLLLGDTLIFGGQVWSPDATALIGQTWSVGA